MSLHPTKLVVLICEEAMESSVAPDLMTAGAKGYTVCEARGRGARGVRDARWLLSSNVRIEILCHEDVAQRLVDMLAAKYSENFGLVVYVQDAQVIRSSKF